MGKTKKLTASRSPGMDIDKFIESEYHDRVPLFTEAISDDKTNDFVAWKSGRVPIKARGSNKTFNINILTYIIVNCHSNSCHAK